VLFRINMYRIGANRRMEAARKVRRLALAVSVVGVNVVLLVLFAQAIFMTNSGIAAVTRRLESGEEALGELTASGRALTPPQLGILQDRAERTSWSHALVAVADLLGEDATISRMWLGELRGEGRRGKKHAFQMRGSINSGREEESVDALMAFVGELREDGYLSASFEDVRLVSMDWVTAASGEVLQFEIACPMRGEK